MRILHGCLASTASAAQAYVRLVVSFGCLFFVAVLSGLSFGCRGGPLDMIPYSWLKGPTSDPQHLTHCLALTVSLKSTDGHVPRITALLSTCSCTVLPLVPNAVLPFMPNAYIPVVCLMQVSGASGPLRILT